jgi:uncharacterized protein (TIGR03435 family)
MRKFVIGLVLAAGALFAQTKLEFEVATVRPAVPIDVAKMMAAVKAGQAPKIGPHIEGQRAEYAYMSLKDLIGIAYGARSSRITGPDWLGIQRFDIVGKLPDGAAKADAPKMLQALLEDRFKLVMHRGSAERPVLALVVGKGGPKLKESGTPAPIDETAPLRPGELTLDSADGPSRMTLSKYGGGAIDMGSRGIVHFKTDPATQTMHMEATMITASGIADMLTQFSQMMGGGSGLQFVDMTGLKGHYQLALDFSQSDRAIMMRSMGLDTPAVAEAATDPDATSLPRAVQALGLKLESRKTIVEQLIVDHAEKIPTGN